MPLTVTEKLIEAHLVEGTLQRGSEIGLRIDQTLTQDATGTLVMLELEAMDLDRVQTELSAQYVDHNMIQQDFRNPDDHLFLESACRRFGLWYSRPGNGVSHPVHQQHFGKPGKTLLGSDSHTPAAGAIGMLAFGAGGLDVAMAMAGEPYIITMPEVWGIELTGELPDWVSAKDVILEMLRRHDVDGAIGCVLEFHGPGLAQLSAMDRHVIANMGTELGATTTVFPSDEEVRRFLKERGREEDWSEWIADAGAQYDREEAIDLSELEPLIAMPSSPGKVRPVREVAGQEIYQSYVGSSANPGYRDFAITAKIVEGRTIPPDVSFDINPTSRELLLQLMSDGSMTTFTEVGARMHQAGCNGCIGMGQAPAYGKYSVRTVPRNFPGRSGTRDDLVCLVSPETAAASALKGEITDPRTLGVTYPRVAKEPVIKHRTDKQLLEPPLPIEEARKVELAYGPNIKSLPRFDELPDELELPVLLKVGDDISTDEILPAGTRVLPYRSNIPRIAEFTFDVIDESYVRRAKDNEDYAGHMVVGGDNYGQGSSREHAALAPRYLGLRIVLTKGFARIHKSNLINFGILPLTFRDSEDYEKIGQGDVIRATGLHGMRDKQEVALERLSSGETIIARHDFTPRQVDILLAGGLIEMARIAKQ
ncbi:MAG: aconitate hydratase [Planctomyces sp.]|nr:aconitate hydratase [Planctomyces sp.]